MLRKDVVKQIEHWAEIAEDGNYHDFAAVLASFAEVVQERYGPEIITLIKSYDEFPLQNNIVELTIHDE